MITFITNYFYFNAHATVKKRNQNDYIPYSNMSDMQRHT